MKHQKGLFWILTEGAAGMQSQAIGLAEAMGANEIVSKQTHLKGIWRWIAPYFRLGWRDASHFMPPWPEVIIACGRKAIPAALWLKKHHHIPVVYVQDPYISPKHFDVVVVPAHDQVSHPHIINMTGSCHRINAQMLQSAKQQFCETLGKGKTLKRSVFIGGPNRCFSMPHKLIQNLISQLQNEPGKLYVTVSRRTPPNIVSMLKEQKNLNLMTPNDKPNPYMGLLAWSDVCILTCDSINMACEIMAAGKSLYLVKLPGGNKKFQQFHDDIEKRDLVRWWQPEQTCQPYNSASFNEMPRVAALVNERLGRQAF